ncbi:MAG: ABC transporter ATP-binding protein/permease [Spirochaetaceae bacterium]|nr:ABC transporter ATP-binding protein/permease [Spirochaetaceae bacterium]
MLDVEALTQPVKARYEEIQSGYEATFPETFALPDLNATEIISLREISFSYTNSDDANAAHIGGFELQCDMNSSTALLGLSGEGKSTIIKLCTGEEKPESGEALFCNVAISALPSPLQNAFINLYSQETDIINDDALGNILMGKTLIPRAAVASTLQDIGGQFVDILEALRHCVTPAEMFRKLGKKQYEPLRVILGLPLLSRLPASHEIRLMESLLQQYTDEEIVTVLAEADFGRRYCVQETVDTLIDTTGIRHLLGRKLGIGGSAISGGERQRIALARCLAKENWKILIVDEPFTSLDVLAETELSQVLRAYTCDKTLLLVTHKLNLVPLLADKVILLEHGSIAATGSHAELKQSSALYSALWEAFSAQGTQA